MWLSPPFLQLPKEKSKNRVVWILRPVLPLSTAVSQRESPASRLMTMPPSNQTYRVEPADHAIAVLLVFALVHAAGVAPRLGPGTEMRPLILAKVILADCVEVAAAVGVVRGLEAALPAFGHLVEGEGLVARDLVRVLRTAPAVAASADARGDDGDEDGDAELHFCKMFSGEMWFG